VLLDGSPAERDDGDPGEIATSIVHEKRLRMHHGQCETLATRARSSGHVKEARIDYRCLIRKPAAANLDA